MGKARKLDLSSTSTLTVRVEGVPVNVSVDANGWPCTITARHTDERLQRLAMAYAQKLAESAAAARAEAQRIQKSMDAKRELALNERALAEAGTTEEWLAAARKKHPEFGAERLAHAARALVAERDPDDPVRKKITEYRAKEYLKKIRNSGET